MSLYFQGIARLSTAFVLRSLSFEDVDFDVRTNDTPVDKGNG